MKSEFDCSGINKMYKDLYWSQIFNRKTSWRVKLIAIQSLWIMRLLK